MTTFAAVILLVSAVWSFIVWPPFLRRVTKDPRSRGADGRGTRFLAVHVVLVSVSLLIAAACAATGIVLLVT
ncbi:SCO4848 family membrane protein [Amnibacterium flavum]|uniref:SCO4848 family membrane protein n=1 Tax=Amnibacterium flavum TaxID=2173173 RepID=UPI001F0CAD0A